MSSLVDLRPGDFGFGPIPGGAGFTVMVGEFLTAPFDHWRSFREWKHIHHVGWVVEAAQPVTVAQMEFGKSYLSVGAQAFRGPLFAQAMPTGFEIVELGAEHWTSAWTYIRPNYRALLTGENQGQTVAAIGQRMVRKKIPYGWEDYAAIAGHRAGIRSKGLDDFIARTDADGDPQRAICSQAADAALTLSGGLTSDGQVFDDKRLPQDVTPSELYLRLLELKPAEVIKPG